MNIAVMGVGVSGAFPTSGGLSYREMIKRAATMAYEDAGVVAEQVEAAVSVEEDFVSGYSISSRRAIVAISTAAWSCETPSRSRPYTSSVIPSSRAIDIAASTSSGRRGTITPIGSIW